MKLLRECFEAQAIVESVQGKPKSYFIEGIFMQSDTPNRNGRIYPKAILAKEVNRYLKEAIIPGTAMSLGQLNHPVSDPGLDLERASHRILKLEWNGKNVMGRAKVIDTPQGRIVKSLMDEGIKLGVSTRGLGSVSEQNGHNVVQDDFVLSTVDIVSDPSVKEAIVENIMESREYAFVDGKIVEIQNMIKQAQGKKQLEEAKLKSLSMLLNSFKVAI